MVRITGQNVQQNFCRRGGTGVLGLSRAKLLEKESLASALGVVGIGLFLVSYVLLTSSTEGKLRATANVNHPDLHISAKNAEEYNAIALDILETLDCHRLLNSSKPFDLYLKNEDRNAALSRRLNEELLNDDAYKAFQGDKVGREPRDGIEERDMEKLFLPDKNLEDKEKLMKNGVLRDDYFDAQAGVNNAWKNPTAKHLFCLAAFASNDQSETKDWKESIKCDATGKAQKPLFELWATARAENINTDLLVKVLEMSEEKFQTVVKKDLYLWAPSLDNGLYYMVSHVNADQKTVDQGGLYGLQNSLGKGKVFVDVGSCLGVTSMAIQLLYPGTRVVSIEVAPPNWLLQEINFRCNAQAFQELPVIILSGVGPAHRTTSFARYTWKPEQVTATRSWTPEHEINQPMDIVLDVKLRPWHSILVQAEVAYNPKTNRANKIYVLNVDCGACEYNLIPSMTDEEFNSIQTVMGVVHWGYIPKQKLPSSARGKETHQRLCKHENFARTAKECCQFPSVEVISSYPGQILLKEENPKPIPSAGTVADVAGGLCHDFATWAAEKHVYDIESDWGWFQLTPSAKE